MSNELTKPNDEARGKALAERLRQGVQYGNGRTEHFLGFIEQHDLSLLESLPAYREALQQQQTRTLKDGTVKTRRYKARSINAYISAAVERINYALDHSPDLTSAQEYEIQKALKKHKKRIKINDKSVPGDRILTYEEIRTLIAEIPSYQFRKRDGEPAPMTGREKHELQVLAAMVEFLAYTALRVSEMLNILLTDIKPINEHYQITIMGKGSKERFTNVNKALVDRVREICSGSVYLFETQDGKQYRRETVSMRIRRYSEAILEHPVSAHVLRHSWATHALKKSGRIKAVQSKLGHSSSSTTIDLYIHDSFTFEEEEDLFK